MLSRVWTLHPEGFAGNERVMCPQYLSKATWPAAYARLVDRPIRCAAGSVEARKADLLRRTIGRLVDTGHRAQVFVTSLCRPPGRCRISCRARSSVRSGACAIRRTRAQRALLTVIFARRQNARRMEDDWLIWHVRSPGCVTAGTTCGGYGGTAQSIADAGSALSTQWLLKRALRLPKWSPALAYRGR